MDYRGTESADVLTGGAADDVIYGFGGNDTLKGGAGDDVLAGNDGNDNLQGGAGDDYILGGAGNDTIDGGDGNDWAAYEDATAGVKIDLTITGSQNTGGSGTDKLTGIENVYGSAFNDTLTGDAKDNMLVGDAGNDTLSGGKGNDTLWGDAGNDVLDGGDGDDYIVGGAGDDIIKGGAGDDWSSYENATAGVSVDLTKTGQQDTIGAGKDTLTGIELLYGSKFDDVLTGDAKDNYLWGSDGNDTISGGAGDDHISGGTGNNWLNGGDGFDTIDYAFSDKGVTINLSMGAPPMGGSPLVGDWLTSFEAAMGSTHDDVITGNAAENYLFGDAGNDEIRGVGGHDTLEGGEGNDTLYAGNGEGDLLLGDVGDDRIVMNEASTNVIVDGGEGADTFTFQSVLGATIDLRITGDQEIANRVHVELRNIENLVGGSGNDHLIGDQRDNVLTGGAADDILDGGAGSDTVSYADDGALGSVVIDLQKSAQALDYGRGIDTLISIENVIGTAGNDNITGNAEANHLQGAAGDDWLYGVGGNDMLDGGAGDDVLIATREGASTDKLFGGAGNDRLVTNKAAATLDGGDGDDVFDVPHLASMAGTIVIDGGAGRDTLDMSGAYGAIANLKIDLSITGKQDVGQGQFLDIKGVENVVGGNGDDILKGDTSDNVLTGHGGYNILDGGAGLDVVSYDDGGNTSVRVDLRNAIQNDLGGRGTDVLTSIEGVRGTAYNDTLIGNDKDNIFIGGAGDDYIDGGAGFDYVSYQNDGLKTGMQVLLKEQWQSLISDRGHDTLISIEGVIGSNYDDFLSGNSGVNVLKGMDGNDGIYGYGGADTLDGGAGDDYLMAYSFNDPTISSAGTVMLGGDGRDTIEFGQGDSRGEGGAGNDWFYVNNLAGHFTANGGEGIDTIQFVNRGLDFLSGITVDLSRADKQQIASGVTMQISSVENVTGSFAGDVITGDANDNTLIGLSGNDTLLGGMGKDTLYGGDGDDLLVGDYGNDVLWGGAGKDTFRFAASLHTDFTDPTGQDVEQIMDFEAQDKIDFVNNTVKWSYSEMTANSFAEAMTMAKAKIVAGEYSEVYNVVKVGGDVFVITGATSPTLTGVDNVVKLVGANLDMIDEHTFGLA